MSNGQPNGWTEWGRHVLSEMERLNGCIEGINLRLRQYDIDMTVLKVKAGVWGVLGGLIPVLVTISIMFLSGHIKTPQRSHDSEFKKLEKQIQELQTQNSDLRRQLDRINVRTAKPPVNE